jgi:uncharacterized phiE125 gp8 family phage protein
MSWNRLKRTVAPASAPVTLGELRSWLRLDLNEDDPLIAQLIQDAVDFIEGPDGIGVALRPQTWEYALDCFPDVIRIPLGPVQSVEAISYVATDGAETTLEASKYRVDTISRPARLSPAMGECWPATWRVLNAVKVTFIAGYDTVQGDLKRAIALLVAHWYEYRDAVIVGVNAQETPMAVHRILDKYRAGRIA